MYEARILLQLKLDAGNTVKSSAQRHPEPAVADVTSTSARIDDVGEICLSTVGSKSFKAIKFPFVLQIPVILQKSCTVESTVEST